MTHWRSKRSWKQQVMPPNAMEVAIGMAWGFVVAMAIVLALRLLGVDV